VLATTPIEKIERAVTRKTGAEHAAAAKAEATSGSSKKGAPAPKQKAVAAPKAKKSSSKELATEAEAKAKPKAKAKHKCAKKEDGKVTPLAGSQLTLKVEKIFELLDADHSGFLEVDELVTGLSELSDVMKVTLSNGEKVTNDMLRHLARKINKTGHISIIEFLETFCYDDCDDVADALAEHMTSVLFRHRHAVRAGCRFFDPRGTTLIKQEEFNKVLVALNNEMETSGMHFSETQMFDLCQSVAVDTGKLHEVHYEDFFNSFMVVDSENSAATVRMGTCTNAAKPPDTKKK